MEELRVTNLLGGALAAISGAVVASFFGVFGTLAGAGVMSIFMAAATAGYAHSLAATHRWMRRRLVRRVGGDAEADTPPAQSIRWQRVAVVAAAVFAIAMGAVTTVEAVARRPLASLLGSQPQRRASTSVGVVVGQSAPPTPRLRAPPPPRRPPRRRRPGWSRWPRRRGPFPAPRLPAPRPHGHSRHAGPDHPAALRWRSRTAAGSAC